MEIIIQIALCHINFLLGVLNYQNEAYKMSMFNFFVSGVIFNSIIDLISKL